MIVALLAWLAVALLLGVLIGKAIRRADAVQFPQREEPAWWDTTTTAVTPRAAEEPLAQGDLGLLAA